MNISEFPDLERAREEATVWIARLDRGLAPAERADLHRWCAASPANTRALRQLSAIWGGLDEMKALADVFPQRLPGSATPEGASTTGGSVLPARSRWAQAAMAASIAVGLVFAGLATWMQVRPEGSGSSIARAQQVSYATAIGEQRDVSLADGSALSINTGSLVQVLSFDGAARELQLLRGEALFTVAHDPSRPFRVRVGKHVVEAVGTAFDIRLHNGGRIDVIVTEGQVRLHEGEVAPRVLSRGDSIVLHGDGRSEVTMLDDAALAGRLAWRDGMLMFDGQTLAAALEEFSRYTSTRFELADPQLRQLRIGGYFPAGDTAFLLDALQTNFGLDAARAPDGSIRIAPGR